METVGVYVHVPFCVSKCPYCDFYSLASAEHMEAYTTAAAAVLRGYGGRFAADTLYFGGGTPSLLGGERLTRLIEAARAGFHFTPDAEMTMEANPGDELPEVFRAFAAAGGNRVSLGVQAADDRLLRLLGRRHTVRQAAEAAEAAHLAGIDNLSLDLMLGLPEQTAADVRQGVAFCREQGAAHLSAYLLKLEAGTRFYEQRDTLNLPDDDTAADLYLTACEAAEENGFLQYEISNYAKSERESRHNLKYWDALPYVGVGPAAHGFTDGRRWYYPRQLDAFLRGETPLAEEGEPPAASALEYALLRLRLTAGLRETDYIARFGQPLPTVWRERAAALPPELVSVDETGIRLTRRGFLLSTPLTERLLWD